MLFTAENILLVGSILLFVSIIVGKTGYRFGVPALLLFLVVGMLFGSDGLGLQFHNAKEAQFIGMVALSIILFSGGMDTKFTEIKPILSLGIVLSSFGVLLTALFTGLFIWWLSGMSWTNIHLPLITSLLLASTMSSTDSASVFAILRSQKMNLKHNLRPMLELESGSNDPMAYMLTVVLIQLIQSSGMGASQIAFSFVIQFVVGAAAGYLLGKLAILMLNRLNIDNQSLYPILLLSFVFFTFSITDLMKGNGYLAVYIAGMMVGNNKIMHRKEIYTFMDGLTWLFQIIMFLCLGLLAKTAILLTEYAAERRKAGMGLIASALSAAKARLRPILMTALTMIFGLLPLMVASGVGANGNRSLGTGAVGGMVIGTLALLFIVPSLFIAFQWLQERIRPVQIEPSHDWQIQTEQEVSEHEKEEAKNRPLK